METSNYNMALELLADYKYELRKQIDSKISERKTFLDNLPYEAHDLRVLDYDMELVRLEDSLYKLDVFLSNFA